MSELPLVSFSDITPPATGTLVFLMGERKDFPALAESINRTVRIERAIKIEEFRGKYLSSVNIIAPDEKVDRLFLVGCGRDDELSEEKWLEIGGKIKSLCEKDRKVTLVAQAAGIKLSAEDLTLIAMGFRLRSYKFDEYKTGSGKSPEVKPARIQEFTICSDVALAARDRWKKLEGVCDGVITARNLVNEPANRLGAVEFAHRAQKLATLGLEVEVLGEKEMQALKMQALLSVNQGSARPPRLVIMKWNGGKKKDRPVSFVGKGVVFDSGGISLKPSKGMEDMKGDMGGAAAVMGLMQALASRKAGVNAVGVIGLVENMPDAAAQRPGDIIESMSGKTIEVINTDAEGRLVLADALWYCQKTFNPEFMIDLATLTGSVLAALGQHHAGLLSNNDGLAENILQAGIKTSEKVWRLPLSSEYDKMIDSKNADMKNVGGRYAGAITAGQFLQRFVNDTPWAHLDVAGTAMGSPRNEYSQSWASGFGVRLLDRLVSDHYE